MASSDPARALPGEWLHSFEEDTPTTLVFRRGDYPFPPSRRPRRTLALAADGSLREGRGGPADRRVWTPGRWSVAGEQLILHASDRPTDQLDIVEMSPDRLVVARSDGPTGGEGGEQT